MPRTAITRKSLTRAGAELDLTGAVDSVNGNVFPTDGTELLFIKNGDASPHTCTIPVGAAAQPDGLTVTGRVITVPAGKTYVAGPFGSAYRQADGTIYLNWDAATSMGVAVYDLP